ncbi:MAG: Do family serine endopeptidase, partial [Planctomycetota bacterium]
MKTVLESLFEKGGVLIVLVSVLCGQTVAADVDTNGIETLRKASKAFSAVAKEATPAVVAVQVRTKVQPRSMGYGSGSPFDDDFFEHFFGRRHPRRQQPSEPQYQVGQASGFIISDDGYVLTNNHVIDDADEITVVDVALLKIEDIENLPYLELGDSDGLEIGEWVIAIGNPFGLTETLTVGVVSALGRKVGGEGVYQDFIQTDAAINPGNSGGPLLNLDGKVIGINSAIITGDRGYMGIGLAVPVNMAKAIKEQLIETGQVQRGYVGIGMQPIDPEMVEFFNLQNSSGALITRVIEDGPAEKAGLKKDDVIIKIGKKNVEDTQDVFNIIGFTAPDTEVEFVIIRNGKEKKVTVKVGSKADSELADTSDLGRKFGLTVKTIDEDIADEYKAEEGVGVVVVEVKSGSPAAQAGIRSGMVILEVNRIEVRDVGEFNEATEESAESGKVLLLVKTGRYAQYAVLQ